MDLIAHDVIEKAAAAIYGTQDNGIPWDSETLGDWRREYEREKARAALEAVNYQGAVEALRKIEFEAERRGAAYYAGIAREALEAMGVDPTTAGGQ